MHGNLSAARGSGNASRVAGSTSDLISAGLPSVRVVWPHEFLTAVLCRQRAFADCRMNTASKLQTAPECSQATSRATRPCIAMLEAWWIGALSQNSMLSMAARQEADARACGQEHIGDRMRLAGVVLQLDWQAALEGSQMMQKPAEFARIAEESVAKSMDRARSEAASRGWLSKDLPSGNPSVNSLRAAASCAYAESQFSQLMRGA